MLPLLGSIELLLADVENVRSSEMSRKQLAALIDEEFHVVETKHMGSKDGYLWHVKNMKEKGFSLLITFIKLTIAFFFIFAIAFVLTPRTVTESVSSLHGYIFTEDTAPPTYSISYVHWYFSALQILRLGSTSLNLERKFPITDIDLDSCIVNNPLYRPSKVRCSLCQGGFVYSNANRNDFEDSPVVRKSNDIKFTVARLQQVLQKNDMMLNQHTISIKTNCDYVHTVEDLKDNGILERLEDDNTSHITGTSLSYMSSHVLRREFPRPQDYFDAAQTYKTYLYVDGKKSSSYEISKSITDSNFMYIQCSGSRRVVFSPPDHCHYKCQTFSRIMKPGDIVFYSNMWTVHSESTNEKSLAFVDNFEWLP